MLRPWGGCKRATCTFFGRPKKVPKKSAATSEARGTAKGLLAPWNPKDEGRGRAGLKNRQDTFFDAPSTRSRLTAPPIKFTGVGFYPFDSLLWLVCRGGIYAARRSRPGKSTYRANRTKGFPLWGKLSPQVTDEGKICGCRNFPGGVGHPALHCPIIKNVSAYADTPNLNS